MQYYLPDTPIHAFKYVDEEGDFITGALHELYIHIMSVRCNDFSLVLVRTDRETADMIKAFVTSNFSPADNMFSAPLVIYPSNDSRGESGSSSPWIRPDLHVEVCTNSVQVYHYVTLMLSVRGREVSWERGDRGTEWVRREGRSGKGEGGESDGSGERKEGRG